MKRRAGTRPEGISLLKLASMFPDEDAARRWLERQLWGDERCCPRCGSFKTKVVRNRKPMPYWCSDCKKYFSVRIGTALEGSNVSLRQWVYAIYLTTTSPKGISSVKLHRDIGVTQKTAWFMMMRLREALNTVAGEKSRG